MTTPRRIYLDQAATSWPKLPAAVQAAEQFIRECGATSGRGAYASARLADQWVTRARHGLAQLLGARDASDVAFCSSGTHALNAVISGLLRPGDTVLTTAIEHNSVLRPLEHWRKKFDVRVVVAPCDPGGFVELPSTPIDPEPRVIIVSHGSNVTGRIQDLSAWSKLAKQCNAILVVDASQTVGYVAINQVQSGVDVLVSAGHKGLGALGGTGFVVASQQVQQSIEPLMWGGTGTSSESLDFKPRWPQSIEVGNHNMPGIVSIAAAAEYWLQNPKEMESWRPGFDRLRAELRKTIDSSSMRIVGQFDGSANLPVISVLPTAWSIHDAAAVLDSSFGIETRAGFHCAALIHECIGSQESGGTLRLSVGHHTASEHITQAVKALGQLCG